MASRRHALIQRENEDFYLVDLDSKNGTLVNERHVEDRVKLSPGDVIRIGDCSLMFARS